MYGRFGDPVPNRLLQSFPASVELYGHEISFKWKTSENGNVHQHIFGSSFLMEFIEGGPLKAKPMMKIATDDEYDYENMIR
ncbi:hypothetical protein F2Q70_00017015 [Brassica cretica]|uniref:Uncharacterized protein n=1 Tax=Brassica cretica TaxID=69181 RepID=A0A8S9HWV3_BRACR|nr:hypothetical protein F2Q70_00017015 [Brassica cretica]